MGGKTNTTTSSVKIPPEVLARYNAVNTQAEAVAQTPFQNYSTNANAFVAPLNTQQNTAITNTNAAAGSHIPSVNVGQGLNLAGAGGVLPTNLDGSAITKYLSPYLGTVLNSQAALINQNNQQQQSGQMGQAIASGAFGGDRSGIAAANLAQQQNLAAGSIYANTLNTGYGQALAAAQGQQELDLGARQADMARLQSAGTNIANMGLAGQGASLAGAEAQLNAGTLGQQTSQAGLSALYNQFQQSKAYPFQVAQFLADIAMGTGSLSGSTTTTTQPASFFSDRRLKHDIRKIGKADNGLTIYSYKYKNDPHERTHVGFMADEVEEKRPEAVGLAAGYKTVDYDRASRAAGGGIGSGGFYGVDGGGGYVPEARLPVGQLMLAPPAPDAEAGLLSELGEMANAGTKLSEGFSNVKGLALGRAATDQSDETVGLLGAGGKYKPREGVFGSMSTGGVADGSGLLDNRVNPELLDNEGYVPKSERKDPASLKDMQSKVSVTPGQSTVGQIGETASTLGDIAKLAMLFFKDGGAVRTGLASGGVPDSTVMDNPVSDLASSFGSYVGKLAGELANKVKGEPVKYVPSAVMNNPVSNFAADVGTRAGVAAAGGFPPRVDTGTGLAVAELPPPRPTSSGVSPVQPVPAQPTAIPPVRPFVSPSLTSSGPPPLPKPTTTAPSGGVVPPVVAEAPTTAALTPQGGLSPASLPVPSVNTESPVTSNGFESSVAFTMNAEGGLNPSDSNGTPSNFGINQAAHPEVDVTKITPEQAKGIYKNEYWDAIGGDALHAQNPQLATMVFDTAVMAGVERAKILLSQSEGDPQKFMALRTNFLNGLIEKNPVKFGKYAESWNNRNQSLASGLSVDTRISASNDGTVNPKVRGTGLDGGDGPRGLGNFWKGLKNGDANSILPLLVGLGDMASSPSRYLGSAMLQGLGGGAQAYMDRQASMANLAQTQATTGLTEAQTAQNTAITQGILTDNLQKATTTIPGIGPAVYVMDAATNSVTIMPLSRYNAIPEGQKPQLINATAYVEGTPPGANSASGTANPVSPIPASDPDTGISVSPLPPASGATITGPAPAIPIPLDGVTFEVGKTNAMSDNIGAGGEDSALSAANAQKVYAEHTAQADSARRQSPYTKKLAEAIGSTATGVGSAGAFFHVFATADSIMNTLARTLGLAGPEESYFGGISDAAQITQKIQTMQGAMVSQGFSQDSAAALSQFMNATPNLTMNPMASATLTAQILADQQRLIDRGAYASNYRAANPTSSFVNFDQSFAQDNPQEKYIRERTQLQYLMLGLSPEGKPLPGKNAFPIIASGQAPVDQARKALVSMGFSPDLVRYFYGGS